MPNNSLFGESDQTTVAGVADLGVQGQAGKEQQIYIFVLAVLSAAH